MKIIIMNFLSILLIFGSVIIIECGQSSSPFGRGFFSSVVTPTSHYSIHHGGGTSSGFVPLTYKSDSKPEESNHRSSSKQSRKRKYKGYSSVCIFFITYLLFFILTSPINFYIFSPQDEDDISSESFTSDEYSNEAKHPFGENDSREYTIGTHIRVQHPITIPKKSTIPPYPTKSSKYTTIPNMGGYSMDVSHEEHGSDSYLPSTSSKKLKYSKLYEPDPFHVISPPNSKIPSHHHHHHPQSASAYGASYNAYEPDTESYENPEVAVKHLKTNLRDRYKGVASKKQIEKYIEDQEKMLDEALKLQLLTSPKFQKLLKTAENEHQFKQPEFEDEYIANVPHQFRDSFHKSVPPKSIRSRRRPQKSKSSVLSKPNRKYRSAFVIEV
ncbi:uncharacterized protein LOC135949604 [Calliphora vicina]|uniref:uncharacterized protein LOC135949604 n=1 Tax=Calliphora vicina TaxID=7373 RepID=UPI00325B3FDE